MVNDRKINSIKCQQFWPPPEVPRSGVEWPLVDRKRPRIFHAAPATVIFIDQLAGTMAVLSPVILFIAVLIN
jgi:hypothetical protein